MEKPEPVQRLKKKLPWKKTEHLRVSLGDDKFRKKAEGKGGRLKARKEKDSQMRGSGSFTSKKAAHGCRRGLEVGKKEYGAGSVAAQGSGS